MFSLHDSRSKTFNKILNQTPDSEICFMRLEGCTLAKKGLSQGHFPWNLKRFWLTDYGFVCLSHGLGILHASCE